MDIVDRALKAELPKLAVDFFVVFSRFEFALKQSGKYALGNDAGVKPDWEKFARDLGPNFLGHVSDNGLAPVLVEKPPKKQVKLADGSLGWRDMGKVTSTTELFLAVRRVRNNLMHGAKYQDAGDGRPDYVEGSERNDALLRQALTVMEVALQGTPAVYECYGRV